MSTYEKLFSVTYTFSTPQSGSMTQHNQFTFMFDKHRKIIMKINKNNLPIKISAAEDNGYSFVLIAAGITIKQEDSN
ncbi:6442_t:CDS:1, partial [Cetraspora pellucida]